jgi:hypothetical protein
MYRLREDLEVKLKGNVDLGTLRWIWHRLGDTGPYGKRYTERYKSAFLNCLPLEPRDGADLTRRVFFTSSFVVCVETQPTKMQFLSLD